MIKQHVKQLSELEMAKLTKLFLFEVSRPTVSSEKQKYFSNSYTNIIFPVILAATKINMGGNENMNLLIANRWKGSKRAWEEAK